MDLIANKSVEERISRYSEWCTEKISNRKNWCM